jgi:ParB-like chromosome segregation protein Spo0J
MMPNYQRVAISSLKFDKRNARKHDRRNIEVIKESLKRFQQKKPIVVSKDGVVIAGNGTLQAAIELGWDEIDANMSELSGEDATAYGLVDNRSSDLSGFEDDQLKELIAELDAAGWDIDGLGWNDDELKAMSLNVDEDDLPDLETEDPEFQQMTFILHNSQADLVKEAINKASKMSFDKSLNSNGNGNSIAYIAQEFLNG